MFPKYFFMKLKAVTNLILLISNISFLVSEVRNYHTRLVKKITIPTVIPMIIIDGSSGLLPTKMKKKKCSKYQMLYLYASLVGKHTLCKHNNSKINTLWFLPCNAGFCSNYLFWFYKRTTCPELDVAQS